MPHLCKGPRHEGNVQVAYNDKTVAVDELKHAHETMIFRLAAEQKTRDDHKNSCDKKLEKAETNDMVSKSVSSTTEAAEIREAEKMPFDYTNSLKNQCGGKGVDVPLGKQGQVPHRFKAPKHVDTLQAAYNDKLVDVDELKHAHENMIFRLIAEQKDGDDYKDWCDKELEKVDTNDLVSKSVSFTNEGAEIRQAGTDEAQTENVLATKASEDVQIVNVIAVPIGASDMQANEIADRIEVSQSAHVDEIVDMPAEEQEQKIVQKEVNHRRGDNFEVDHRRGAGNQNAHTDAKHNEAPQIAFTDEVAAVPAGKQVHVLTNRQVQIKVSFDKVTAMTDMVVMRNDVGMPVQNTPKHVQIL